MERSELGRQVEIAESEFKSWFSMDMNMSGLLLENKGSDLADRTKSQNLSLSFGSVWTGLCVEFYWEITNLN